MKEKKYDLILSVESFYTINQATKKVKEYHYMDVESTRPLETRSNALYVRFYKKDPKVDKLEMTLIMPDSEAYFRVEHIF